MAATPEQDAAQKEAHEYWGYMFKPDKTGTDKLKNLLRGLHHIIVCMLCLRRFYRLTILPGHGA